MNARAHFLRVIAVMAAFMSGRAAIADGGVVVWTGERLGARAAVLVSPATMRVGMIEFAWIGRHTPEATVVATSADGTVLHASLPDKAPAASGAEVHAFLALVSAGSWHIEVDPDGNGEALPAVFPVEIAVALPAWTSCLPELLAWLPCVLLGLAAASRLRKDMRQLPASFE